MAWYKRNPLASGQHQRRSLFGEILDWMLAPLLILWPMSIGVTYLVAKSIANDPFDHILDDKITAAINPSQIAMSAVLGSIDAATGEAFGDPLHRFFPI